MNFKVIKYIVGLSFAVFFVSLAVVIARGNVIDKIIDINSYEDHEYEYVIEEEYTEEDFDKFILEAKNGPVKIEKSDTDKITVSIKYDKEDQFSINEEDGNLHIKDNTKWSFHISFGIFSNQNRSYIVIKVPEGIEKNFKIRTTNSYINVKDVNFTVLNIGSSNGTLTLKNVDVSGDIDMYTSNGKIILDNVNANSIDADTSNGRINVKNVDVINRMLLDSSNGRIEVSDVTGKLINADTSNGTIDFVNVYVEEAILDTSNGDITYTNDDLDYEIKIIDYNTSNGSETIRANFRERR